MSDTETFYCSFCDKSQHEVRKLVAGIVLHVDHIVPVSRGGLSEMDNLQTLCATCNFGKGAR